MLWLYKAVVGNVVDYDTVDFNISLGFGVFMHRRLKVYLSIPNLIDVSQAQKALRCMVILLGGGKKVLLELSENENYATIYLSRKVANEHTLDIAGKVVADINSIMKKLYSENFDPDYLVNNILKN